MAFASLLMLFLAYLSWKGLYACAERLMSADNWLDHPLGCLFLVVGFFGLAFATLVFVIAPFKIVFPSDKK
jgi:hypothetical protein